MAQLFKSFVPAEFLDAWTRGQYAIGPRTLDYQYAGLALMLQGFYRYDVNWEKSADKNKEHRFGGYAVVYIKDNELNFAGLRVYNTTSGEPTPLFWKSVFSRFIGNSNGDTEIYFPYHTFTATEAPGSRDTSAKIDSRAKWSIEQRHLDEIETNIMNANKSPIGEQSPDLHCILSKLSDPEFPYSVGDPMVRPTLRGLCMLEPPSASRLPQQDKQDPKWDHVLIGQNYGVVVEQPMEGTVVFKRLTKSFLDKIEPTQSQDREGAER